MPKPLTRHHPEWTDRLPAGLGILLTVLLIGLPFHAILVIMLGHWFGHQLVWASWKEILAILIIVGSLAVGWSKSLVKHKSAKTTSTPAWWLWLIRPANLGIGIGLLGGLIATGLTGRYDVAWLAGIKTTALPLVLCVAVQPLASLWSDTRLRQLIVWPAILVAIWSVLQFLIIPTAFLESLGYSASTIVPYQSVHPGFEYGRSFSTLGGPNQLGTYLILPAIWLLYRAVTAPGRQARLISSLAWIVVVTGLAVSFSRSAILGLVVATLTLGFVSLRSKWRWVIPIGSILAALVIWGSVQSIVGAAGNSPLKSFLLRGSLTSSGDLVGGDSGHVEAVATGWKLVQAHPLGLGFGAAGPASFYASHPVLTENWWLQIAIELGVIGAVGIALAWGSFVRWWYARRGEAELVLIASITGLAVTGLFLHSLADSTLGLIFWTLAGLVYGRERLKS